ncbi:MAG: PH domain-containing protein [Microbacteriaceae bacterium]|nr:PH domain-containing protein [Microbacteriaceae bacterium]
MLPNFTLHSRFGRILTIIIAVSSVLILIVTVMSSGWGDAATLLLPLALVTTLTWSAFWQPAVIVHPGGVTLRNVFRTINVAWPEIRRIDTKFALSFDTVHGTVTAWAAPAPDRHAVFAAIRQDGANLPESTYLNGTVRPGDLITTDSGQAAYVIRTRWEKLRDEGHLDIARSEFSKLRVTWHVRTLVVLSILIAATGLSTML